MGTTQDVQQVGIFHMPPEMILNALLDNVRLPVPCHCEAAIVAEAISLRV